MHKLLVIAQNTFREAIRDKILYSIFFFAFLLLIASIALGELSLGHQVKVTKDLGLSAISFFGILIAIFTGVSLVHKEIDKRTLYTLLSKPIYRYQFVLGKYLGMLLTAFAQLLLLGVIFTFLLLYQQKYVEFGIYQAILLYWMEIMLITSIALFFSSFTTPFFSGLFTFSIFLIGRLMPEIELLLKRTGNPIVWLLLKGSTALPNLNYLNVAQRVVHQEPIPPDYILSSATYTLLYIGLFLFFSSVLFARRDFI
ncbi:MAG: ABC transporter permease subunit [Myxococcales bacterium]|nr:ABC transporter permease subunit [Myxococcales bacterium]MCB9644232.1 ABC transporter permease subunit [Myxococcales bacterium]